jgi:RNA 2',3'-cyclic 3'-phosphodiesterase
MMRTFVAVELEGHLHQAISRLQDQMKDQLQRELKSLPPDVRLQWVRPGSLHLTLKFLGDVEESRVQEICDALTNVAGISSPFALDVKGLGVFPDIRAPRVLWVGIADRHGCHGQLEQLMRLVGTLDEVLGTLGFPRETKPFQPHLTLARIKERPREIGKLFVHNGLLQRPVSLGTLEVKGFSLMKSVLKPSGSIYTRLCEASFGK